MILVCFVVAVAMFIMAGTQLDYINSKRQEMKLVINEPLENAPPSLAFATVAMGAFRGLVVDILWMRADKLKEEGQFFDAKQLAEWITILQPRFGSVWEFQAWNMSYNISVAMPATQPDQRWKWVKNGYELLRDQGIKLNPKSIRLYHELCRIFQHKIGDVADDCHKYYKIKLAESMEPLLGAADEAFFDVLAETSTEWEQIANDPSISPIIKALVEADETFVDKSTFVSNYLSLRQNPNRFKGAAFNVIESYRGTASLDKLDIFAKASQLVNVWKLEPALMRRINQRYGPVNFSDPNKHLPMDWRHPNTHSIYWAIKGLEIAREEKDREITMHEMNTDRIVVHSLQNLFRNGKIFIHDVVIGVDPNNVTGESKPIRGKNIFLRPDLRMFNSYNKAILAAIEKYQDDRGRNVSLQNGHRNMLKNALFLFYQAGHQKQALEIYNELRKLYPLPEFNGLLVEYVKKRFIEELESIGIHDAKEQIMGLLRESYYLYAIRSDDEAFGREKLAKEIHEYYQGLYSDENRIDLPEMKLLRYAALYDFIYDDQFPVYLREGLLSRIKIERPDLYKQLEQEENKIRQQQQQPG